MNQRRFSADELLASHEYAKPQREAGFLLHGGLDAAGHYIPPRSLHRPRAIRAWRVPRKGDCTMAAAPLALEGVRGFGVSAGQAVTFKCDNEPAAIIALRRRVMTLHGGGGGRKRC